MADVFDEVDEDLRREKLESAWKRYGTWFLTAALLIVAGTLALQWWKADVLSGKRNAGTAFEAALETASGREPEDAARTLAGFAESSGGGFAVVAWLQSAAFQVDAGKLEPALAIYNRLADSEETPVDLRNVARILAAGILVETAGRAEVEVRLGPTLDGSSPWRFSAREMIALADLKAGNSQSARDIFQQLASDQETPPDMRRRAGELVRALAPPAG